MSDRKQALKALDRIKSSWQDGVRETDLATIRAALTDRPAVQEWSRAIADTVTRRLTLYEQAHAKAYASVDLPEQKLIDEYDGVDLTIDDVRQAVRLLRSAPSAPPSDDPTAVLRAWEKARDVLTAPQPQERAEPAWLEGSASQVDTRGNAAPPALPEGWIMWTHGDGHGQQLCRSIGDVQRFICASLFGIVHTSDDEGKAEVDYWMARFRDPDEWHQDEWQKRFEDGSIHALKLAAAPNPEER